MKRTNRSQDHSPTQCQLLLVCMLCRPPAPVHALTQSRSCTASLQTEQPAAMKNQTISNLPVPACSTKHKSKHVLALHRGSGSLFSMPWCLYWRVAVTHNDKQCGITFDGGLSCMSLCVFEAMWLSNDTNLYVSNFFFHVITVFPTES